VTTVEIPAFPLKINPLAYAGSKMNDLRLWTFEELMALQAGSGAGAGGFATAAEQIPFGAGCLTSAEEQGNGSTSVEEQACIIIPFPRHEPLPPDIVNRPWLGRYIGPNTKIHRNVYATDAFRNGGPGGAPTPKPSYVFNLKSSTALEHLMTLKQWVVWDFVWKNGRWTKVPQNVYGGAEKYKWGEQKYWGSYTDAIETRGRGRGHDGIGYIIGPDDDITGIDLDHCLDPASGELEPWAQEIVDCNETYCEISPSGAGLRFFAKGKIDRTRKCNEAGTEVYRSGRFLTVTGATRYRARRQPSVRLPRRLQLPWRGLSNSSQRRHRTSSLRRHLRVRLETQMRRLRSSAK
jgi:hypothetical protein